MPGWGNPPHCVVVLHVGEGSEREQCCLLHSLLVFNYFPSYPQSNWALLVLIPGWMGLRTFYDPVGLSSELSCEAGNFSCCHLNPHRSFQSEALRLFPPYCNPGLYGLSLSLVVPPGLSVCEHGSARPKFTISPGPPTAALPTLVLQPLPCHESSLSGCLSPPLLPVWMNISSLTPWLLDFHIVQFSVSSGCFLFLNLLLSFFWLCKEAQCVYLGLHLGWKSKLSIFM